MCKWNRKVQAEMAVTLTSVSFFFFQCSDHRQRQREDSGEDWSPSEERTANVIIMVAGRGAAYTEHTVRHSQVRRHLAERIDLASLATALPSPSTSRAVVVLVRRQRKKTQDN